MPATAKLGHRRGKRGALGKESIITIWSHVSKQESPLRRRRGMEEELHSTRRENQDANQGRTLESDIPLEE